jgi:hypothetical protein
VQNPQDLYYISKAHGLTPFVAAIISSLSAKIIKPLKSKLLIK